MSQFQVDKQVKEKKIYTYYEIKDGKLIRKLKKCPRCGVFMAHHKNRWACGSCSYTEYISVDT